MLFTLSKNLQMQTVQVALFLMTGFFFSLSEKIAALLNLSCFPQSVKKYVWRDSILLID